MDAPLVLQLERPFLLNGYNHTYYRGNVVGTLSVKTMFHGKALYEAAGSQMVVDDSRYLILNHQQPYSITIESDKPVESFCVFYPDDWAEKVLQGLLYSDDDLLDERVYDPALFYEIPHPHDAHVTPIMRRLMHAHKSGATSQTWFDEQLNQLIAALLHVQRGIYRQAEQLPMMRQATRLELYRRLRLAQEYMWTNLAQNLTLDDIAGVACLSRFHFLRAFKQLCAETPHQYLTRLRLERAANLLKSTQLSILEIIQEVGFQSPGSFSTLFKRVYAVSPRVYRNSQF